MTTTVTLTSLTNFANAFAGLEVDSSNWYMFQKRFTVHVKQKDVWEHFDGTNEKPEPPSESAAEGKSGDATKRSAVAEYKKELKAWDKRENLALTLLIQKLPDVIYAKYEHMESVTKIWKAIVSEFMSKSMLAQSSQCSEFMAMRYKKGESLRSEFDHV